jgi:tRNA threonylcarbamoyl adenosine modification protein (Sua5/YciO/YrdC/YwlC family)
MSARFDCADPAQRAKGLAEAEAALRRGELVVLPTDTVYGVAAEAFDPVAVESLLRAKGQSRELPPSVLVGTVRAATALVSEFSQTAKDLIDEFWPGGLTLISQSSPTLVWDLGETKGTVAIRMPLHPVALDLLKQTGPLAVSSAKRAETPGMPVTATEAEAQLGDAVAVYLDGGPCPGNVPSTIIDVTGTTPRLLRAGVISADRLRAVVPLADLEDATAEPDSSSVTSAEAAGDEPAAEDVAGDITGGKGSAAGYAEDVEMPGPSPDEAAGEHPAGGSRAGTQSPE